MKIEIEYRDREVRAALDRLRRAARDLRPAMRDIAAALEDSVLESFDAEASPDGDPWAPLSEATRSRRERRGTWPGMKLQAEGALVRSVSSAHDADSAVAGTNLVSAPVHQFGAKKGEFGSTRRGTPIPWGDIPARPFLGVSAAAREDISDILGDHFRRAVNGP